MRRHASRTTPSLAAALVATVLVAACVASEPAEADAAESCEPPAIAATPKTEPEAPQAEEIDRPLVRYYEIADT